MKKLSRLELKLISGGIRDPGLTCNQGGTCKVVSFSNGTTTVSTGTCSMTSSGTYTACYCSAWG